MKYHRKKMCPKLFIKNVQEFLNEYRGGYGNNRNKDFPTLSLFNMRYRYSKNLLRNWLNEDLDDNAPNWKKERQYAVDYLLTWLNNELVQSAFLEYINVKAAILLIRNNIRAEKRRELKEEAKFKSQSPEIEVVQYEYNG